MLCRFPRNKATTHKHSYCALTSLFTSTLYSDVSVTLFDKESCVCYLSLARKSNRFYSVYTHRLWRVQYIKTKSVTYITHSHGSAGVL